MSTAMRRETKPAAAMIPTSRLDWLQSVAQEAHPGRAEAAPLDGPASGSEGWAAICRAHGLDEGELSRLIAARFDLPVADFRRVDPRALRLVPEKVARRFGIVPLPIEKPVDPTRFLARVKATLRRAGA